MADMTKMYKALAEDLIEQVIEHEGLILNDEECSIVAILEYIGIVNQSNRYTIYDWIKDTKQNYPESFKTLKRS